jgi:hypothetical protein
VSSLTAGTERKIRKQEERKITGRKNERKVDKKVRKTWKIKRG